MGIAIVQLHWTPEQFWRSTPHEFWSAIEILEEMNKED
jgi:hypothetical protein